MVTSCTSKVSICLGKCTGTEQNTVMKGSLKMGRLPSSVSSKTGNWIQPKYSVLAVKESSKNRKHMLILFQKQLQKNLCEYYTRDIGVIHRPHDNIGGCLSGPRSFRDWRYKVIKWHGWTWSCGRSNNNQQSSGPMVCESSYMYCLLCRSWTGKHCTENLEENIGSNDTLNHNLSRLNDTVIPRKTCILHFLTHRSRRN